MNDDTLVAIARALADPTRYKMLQEIRSRGEMTCTDVHECFRLAQPTISHHLNTLHKAGLIKVRKEGVFHHLSAVPGILRDFSKAVGATPGKAAARPAARPAKGRVIRKAARKPAARAKTVKV